MPGLGDRIKGGVWEGFHDCASVDCYWDMRGITKVYDLNRHVHLRKAVSVVGLGQCGIDCNYGGDAGVAVVLFNLWLDILQCQHPRTMRNRIDLDAPCSGLRNLA